MRCDKWSAQTTKIARKIVKIGCIRKNVVTLQNEAYRVERDDNK